MTWDWLVIVVLLIVAVVIGLVGNGVIR